MIGFVHVFSLANTPMWRFFSWYLQLCIIIISYYINIISPKVSLFTCQQHKDCLTAASDGPSVKLLSCLFVRFGYPRRVLKQKVGSSLQQGFGTNTPKCKTLLSTKWSSLTRTFLDATPSVKVLSVECLKNLEFKV